MYFTTILKLSLPVLNDVNYLLFDVNIMFIEANNHFFDLKKLD